MKSSRPILLVEDDEVDAMTIRRALKTIKVTNQLDHVTNGEEALAHLRSADKKRPCIILLDLNMPRMGGIEFLEHAKADTELRRIPVVVLTSSTEERDRIASFDKSVAGYMVKPVDYGQFIEVMKAIDLYWTLSEFPQEGNYD
ncbi:MAG: response regulator [Anaerolineae bacterium]